MHSKNSLGRIITIFVVVTFGFILSACTQEQPVLSIYGNWRSATHFFEFNEDGTWAVAWSDSLLQTNPFDWGTFTFDGKTLTFSTDENADSCPGRTGVWEVDFPNETEIIYTEIDEQCSHRRNDIGVNKYKRYTP